MMTALIPSSAQVFPERLHHPRTRLHAASLREFLQPDPFVDAAPIDSQLPGHFSHFHPRRLHFLDRLKQLDLLLAMLFDRFPAVLNARDRTWICLVLFSPSWFVAGGVWLDKETCRSRR